MNLVEIIKEQLTSQAASKLASLIGSSEEKTQSAIGATIPALLASLAGISKGGGKGAEQLTTALSGFGSGTPDSLIDAFLTSPDKVQEQGSGLLNTLLSDGIASSLSSLLAKFTSLDANIVKKLLGYLSPFVLSTIANQFKGKAITPQGVSGLFADQKDNISQALPAGLNLDSIMGLANSAKAPQQAAARAPSYTRASHENEGSFIKPLLTVGALVLLGWFAWQMLFKTPEVVELPRDTAAESQEVTAAKPIIGVDSEAMQMPTDLQDTYKAVTESLTSIKDVDSAEVALPKLNELNGKLEGLVALWNRLPEAAQAKAAEVTGNNLDDLKKVIEPVLAIPGVEDILGPVIQEIVLKLQELGSST